MPNEINTENPQLFQQLLEQEQELISGGGSNNLPSGIIFFRQTNIINYATSQIKFSNNELQFSSNQTSFSSFSETTFLFIPSSGGGRRNRAGRININQLMSWFR